jgi:PTH1 family peptidyl-tRNA hydrolase
MENIIYQLQTNKFPRLRLGIGTEENMRPAEEYVLKPFKSDDEIKVKEMIQKGTESLDSILIQGINYSMNKYNN